FDFKENELLLLKKEVSPIQSQHDSFDGGYEEKKSGNLGLICNLNRAENTVFELAEIKEKYKHIDSISNHRAGISFMSDSLELNGVQYYRIRAGYSSELRFESYYTFYVEKENCNNSKVFEPFAGEIITLEDWRNKDK